MVSVLSLRELWGSPWTPPLGEASGSARHPGLGLSPPSSAFELSPPPRVTWSLEGEPQTLGWVGWELQSENNVASSSAGRPFLSVHVQAHAGPPEASPPGQRRCRKGKPGNPGNPGGASGLAGLVPLTLLCRLGKQSRDSSCKGRSSRCCLHRESGIWATLPAFLSGVLTPTGCF